MTKERASWGSRLGFILSAAGFSVGLGNIWRFPYLVGTNGGGAFVLVYLLICIVICVPLFMGEVAMGRHTQSNPVKGMRMLTKKGSPWVSIGYIGALICVILMSYYLVIIGWMLSYTTKLLMGTFAGMSTGDVVNYFATFKQDAVGGILFTAVVVAILGFVSSKGLKGGIEKACTVLMPALVIMLIVLAIRSLTLPNAMSGMTWYVTPDFSKIDSSVVLAALGQAFFSIGIGCSCAFIYGSFLSKDSNLVQDCGMVVGLDVGIALIAGVVIFPALFSFGMEPSSGMGLVFETMPVLFTKMPLGNLFGAMFFFLIAVAGFTSAIGYLEGVVTVVEEEFNLDRAKAVWLPLGLMFLLSIPCTMSLAPGALSEITIMGKNLFDFADYLSGNVLMPINSLLIAAFVAYVWKFESYQKEANVGSKGLKVAAFWKPIVTIVCPLAVAYISIAGWL